MCKRCSWAKDELDILYHDNEWGKPLYDDEKLFEFLVLEGMQAGLTWSLILKRREGLRKAFFGFDPDKCAKMSDEYIEECLKNPEIIRARLKVQAVRKNAIAYFKVVEEFGNFKDYIWSFVGGKPIVNEIKTMEDVPTDTEISKAMSKDLKKRGFTFVGPVICYAFMQATGMVNDHLVDCIARF